MSGLKVGEIDIGDQVLQNEYLTEFILALISLILDKNKNQLKSPTAEEIVKIRDQVVQKLKARYPNSGLKLDT